MVINFFFAQKKILGLKIKMKSQGTLSKIVDHINNIWPFRETSILIEDKVNGTIISITGHLDLTFEILVGEFKFISQPVVFSVTRYAIFCITWDFTKKDPIKFYLNGQEIKSFAENKDKFVITHSPTSFVLNHEDVNGDFDDHWKKWRLNLYNSDNVKLKEGRVFKSIDEQFEELKLSIYSLETHLNNFSSNQKLLLFNILPIIRSLLFWREKSKTYNPLLFRLAGCLNHSLLIYTLSEVKRQEILNNIKESTQFIYSDSVSINKYSPNHVPTDFQEWLNTKVIFESSEFSNKDIIGFAANTMSFAHFDIDTYLILKDLIDKRFLQTSMLLDIVIQITQISIHFGKEILKSYNEKKIVEM